MQMSNEHRRKKPSLAIPLLYEVLELLLIWVVFSIFEGTLNVTEWGLLSYALSSVWFLYTLYKLKTVLSRQVTHKY